MSIKLRRLQLPDDILDKLLKNNLRYCKDILCRSSTEIMRLCDVSHSQVRFLLQACSHAVSPCFSNALLLKKTCASERLGEYRNDYLPTSLQALDEILRGGLPNGTISEITGPSGCGKTQFCLMLAAIVSSYKDTGVLYIDTEGAFSAHRLLEILQARFSLMNAAEIEGKLTQVHVISVHTCSSLLKCVQSMEDLLISKNIKLICIDSIASLMRKEFSSASQSIIERTNLLTNLASILKYTAEFFRIPVLTTNQITTQFRSTGARPRLDEEEEGEDLNLNEAIDIEGRGELIAALGNTWSHSVNTRLILEYLPDGTRQVLVAKSPVSAFGSILYRIETEGLVQIGKGALLYAGTDPGLQRISSKSQYLGSHSWTS